MVEGVVESKRSEKREDGKLDEWMVGKAGWESSQASGERTRGSPDRHRTTTQPQRLLLQILEPVHDYSAVNQMQLVYLKH